jgi:hypothetical protein
VNSKQRLREVIAVCHRLEVARDWMPPDWSDWGYCPDCQANTGQPCYDVLGSTTAWRVTDRMNPHEGRAPAGVA